MIRRQRSKIDLLRDSWRDARDGPLNKEGSIYDGWNGTERDHAQDVVLRRSWASPMVDAVSFLPNSRERFTEPQNHACNDERTTRTF